MNPLTALVTAGAVTGLGLTLLIGQVRPAPPSLTAILNPTSQSQQGGWRDRLGARLAALPGAHPPEHLLELTGTSGHRHVADKTVGALIGLAAAPYLTAMAHLGGTALPLTIPAAGSLFFGALGWLVPDSRLRSRARRARTEYLHAIALYLDLVALHRAGDRGMTEALDSAARAADSAPFTRIAHTLAQARTTRTPPGAALARLGHTLDLPVLGDVAGILALHDRDGTAVYDALRARAAGLRDELLAAERDQAGRASTRMLSPGILVALSMIVLVLYPALVEMASTLSAH